MTAPANTQLPRKIDLDALKAVLDCANFHIDDIKSGIEDGTYLASENTELPEMQQAVTRIADWHSAESAALPVRKPQVYVALEFSAESDGERTYTTLHVAAVSNADAIQALRDDGINSKTLFLVNRDERSYSSAVERLAERAENFITEAAFRRWVSVSINPIVEDGENHPATWIHVPYIEPSAKGQLEAA